MHLTLPSSWCVSKGQEVIVPYNPVLVGDPPAFSCIVPVVLRSSTGLCWMMNTLYCTCLVLLASNPNPTP